FGRTSPTVRKKSSRTAGRARSRLEVEALETRLVPTVVANGLIAFTTDRDSGNWEIYTMKADGTGLTNLTQNAATHEYPTWSPDGTQIAFTTNRDGNREIYVMNADGTGLTNLTQNAADDSDPVWSPYGNQIAFTRNGDIYVMNTDGTD